MEEYKFPSNIGLRHFNYIGPSIPIATFYRQTLATFWHHHGRFLVNKVVDSHLKVIGVDSLRVVDASTYYNAPGTNP
ncbi:putative (R)-mandelonitrile lyase [Helianthus anomalus]